MLIWSIKPIDANPGHVHLTLTSGSRVVGMLLPLTALRHASWRAYHRQVLVAGLQYPRRAPKALTLPQVPILTDEAA